MRNLYRFTSLMCVLILTSALTLAAGGTLPGAGTEADPYLIEDLDDFDAFADPANAATYWAAGIHTKLMTDIDLSEISYTQAPIETFNGNFDGQNHTIFGLEVTGSRLCGLFGLVSGTSSESVVIKNLVLQKCNITSNAAYNGCLIGWAAGYATVQNCHVKQSQVASSGGLIGGLIGYAGDAHTVTPSIMISMCSVVDSNVSGLIHVGGLIGATTPATIQNCYVNCSVQGTSDSIGGLVGEGRGNNVITNCYSTGSVSGVNRVGGLVGSGSGSIENCYSTSLLNGNGDVGGLCGLNSGSVTNSFWDMEASGWATGDGGEGKTTEQMMTQSTFAGWDFTSPVWKMLRPGEDYPRLAWQETYLGDIAGLYGVDLVDFAYLANYWGQDCDSPACDRADIDESGTIDLPDLAAVAADWLR